MLPVFHSLHVYASNIRKKHQTVSGAHPHNTTQLVPLNQSTHNNTQNPVHTRSIIDDYLDCMPVGWLERVILYPGILIPGKTKLKDTKKYFNNQNNPSRKLANLIQKTSFTSSTGTKHSAWFVPPEAGKPVIIYSGGNTDSLRSISKFKQLLTEGQGYGFLIYEYPGYGRTKGKPSETQLYAALEAASDFLKDKKNIPVSQQVAYGLCLGGAVTMDAASRRPFKGIVLESPMASVPEILEQEIRKPLIPSLYPQSPLAPYVSSFTTRVKNKYDSLSKAPDIKSKLLILHADGDPQVPKSFAEALYNQVGTSSERKRLELIPCQEHEIPKEEILKKIKLFLDSLDSPSLTE